MEFKKHFELVKLDDGDNGMGKMVRIVHKDSKINCTLVIGSDRSVASSKLLHDYLATHPICKFVLKKIGEETIFTQFSCSKVVRLCCF